MKKIAKMAALIAAAALCMGSAFADTEKGYEIMKKASDVKQPAFSHSLVAMTLTSKDGTKEVRQVEEFGKNKDGLDSIVMVFLSPASVKGTRFLQIQNDGRADDKWIYLPSLKSTRRVNSSEGSKSFMGTDATYDDLTTRDVDEDIHDFLLEEQKNGYDCWKIKETPKDKASSQYNYRITWVDKKTYYPIYTEMYDKNDKLVKILSVEKIENQSGYDTPMVNVLKNVQTGHSTTLEIVKLIVDQPIPDRVFTQSFLSTGK